MIVNDLARDGGERVAQGIRANGGRAQFAHGDVSKGDDVTALLDAAVQHFGQLDVVVNNAGITHRNQPLLEVTEAEFDRVFAVNVKSIYWTAIKMVPYFRTRGGGCFVNIASTAGVRPRPGLTWYNGSKGAVIVTSRSMAAELGPDRIRVNCVNPVIGATGLVTEFMGSRTRPRTAASSSPASRSDDSPRPPTSPMPACISPPTRPSSSPAPASRSTAAAAYRRAGAQRYTRSRRPSDSGGT